MAGGGNIRIIDEGDVTKGGRGARVRDHRVWVEATVVGGITITPPLNVRLQDGVGTNVVTVLSDSAVASPGGQAAGIMAASLAKTPSVVGIVSVNDLAFLRSDLAGNLCVMNFMRDPLIVTNVCNVVCDGDAGDESTACGIPPMFQEVGGFPTIPDGDWSHAHMSRSGEILVTARVTDIIPGIASTSLGKREDDAHASLDVGVMALGVRQDVPAALAGTDGDYMPAIFDALGRLWVRNFNFESINFSASTAGLPIQIAAIVTAGTSIHVTAAVAGQEDRVYLWATNTSTSAVSLTIEFGGTGAGNEIEVIVPAQETIKVLNGATIGDGTARTIAAYAGATNVLNVFGRVERIPA